MPTQPVIMREVAAFRIIYKCGHRGVVVANVRGKRARNSARRRAEALTAIPCATCEREERENPHDEVTDEG